MPSVRLVGDTQRAYAKRLIDEAAPNDVVKIGKETRSEEQNRKLWPMLTDLQRQVPEMATHTNDDIKLRFLNALARECSRSAFARQHSPRISSQGSSSFSMPTGQSMEFAGPIPLSAIETSHNRRQHDHYTSEYLGRRRVRGSRGRGR
jgi:hypothetical protein